MAENRDGGLKLWIFGFLPSMTLIKTTKTIVSLGKVSYKIKQCQITYSKGAFDLLKNKGLN